MTGTRPSRRSKLIAQGTALLLQAFQARLQGRALGLKLTSELHHLPNPGSEGIEILQHGRYGKPSSHQVDRGK